jgi:hypothetical protein
VYKVSEAQLQLQGNIFRLFSLYSPETPSQIGFKTVKQKVENYTLATSKFKMAVFKAKNRCTLKKQRCTAKCFYFFTIWHKF